MSRQIDIIITVNSPGEVSGWVKPVVRALRTISWRSRITVFVPPCAFASGAECGVLRSLPEVDLVIGPGETLRYAVLGKPPAGFEPQGTGVVLFLGGDLTYAAILAKRLRYPAVAYTEGLTNWKRTFARYAVPYAAIGEELRRRGIPEEQVAVIGNLMVDAVRPEVGRDFVRERFGVGERPALLLMPGSRPAHFEYMFPFFLRTAELVAAEVPGISAFLSISPFISDRQVNEALSGDSARLFGVRGEFHPGETEEGGATRWDSPGVIRTGHNLMIPALRGRQYDLMAASDLALTILGTNTAELSFLGIPMVVTLPLSHPERIPLEGLAGLIGGLPVLGRELKKRLLPRLLKKVKYTAWPNRLAGEFIVPEVRGKVGPEDVARVAAGLLSDEKERTGMARRLRKVVGDPGAVLRLINLLREVLTERYGDSWLNFK